MNNDLIYFQGIHAIRAAIEAQRRPVAVLYVDGDNTDRDMRQLKRLAKESTIPVKRRTRKQLDKLTQGGAHGGAVAQVGQRHFQTLDELIADVDVPLVVLLDGVEDPYNFGYAIRSLYAAGVHGLVVRERNWTQVPHAAATIARASAGTLDLMPMATVADPQEAIDFFQTKDMTIAATSKTDEAVSLYEADCAVPMFLMIGGERRGISKKLMAQADLQLTLPYGQTFDASLGTVAAVSAIAFEVMRQRKT